MELLTVIVIIALLSAIVIPRLNGTQVKARDVERITDIKNLQIALERYFNKNSVYPSSMTNSCAGWSLEMQDLMAEGFISSLPTDPKNDEDDGYCYQYQSGRACDGGSGTTGYVVLFKPENFDTFGGVTGGESGVLDWSGSDDWLCLEP